MMNLRHASIASLLVGATLVAFLFLLPHGTPRLDAFSGTLSLFLELPAIPDDAKSNGPSTKGTLTLKLDTDVDPVDGDPDTDLNGSPTGKLFVSFNEAEFCTNTAGDTKPPNFLGDVFVVDLMGDEVTAFQEATTKDLEKGTEGLYLSDLLLSSSDNSSFANEVFRDYCFEKWSNEYIGVVLVHTKTISSAKDTDGSRTWVAEAAFHVVRR